MAKYNVSWSFPYKQDGVYLTRNYKTFASAKKRMYKELVRLINVFSQDFEEDKLEFCENEFEVIISYMNGDEEKMLLIITIDEFDD